MQKKETGFSVIELLLILVVLGIVGFAGWFVYNSHKKTEATLNQASQDSSNIPVPKPKKSSPGQTASNSATTVFKIPELGIEITVPNSIKDIEYKVNKSGPISTGQEVQSVTLSTKTLTKLDSDCSINGSAPALGDLSKAQGQYAKNPDVTLNNVSGALIKQYSSYYIAWLSPQSTCGSKASTQTAATAGTNLFSKALKSTLEPIQ